ncbi:OPT superfamily oligopeptide transporter [Tuber magnatum]|uniref:OPT superfamily oligopeptide transporter n=1 Tax=Tuber magnatum TaxID=42249 RepID=A0A317SN29_9PEZI|nr:OPT superfamily oligopeptide transporter [Tuber magnatum]
MSMPSSLIGFAIFKSCVKYLEFPFTPAENVLVQTVAVAVGSMPLSAGFVGVIPALEKLLKPEEGGPLRIGTPQLMFWSIGVAFFGVFFAVPLRKQVIIKEKLRFPSGTATALMISVLHGNEKGAAEVASGGERAGLVSSMGDGEVQEDAEKRESWRQKTGLLVYSFALSGTYTFISYFFPILRDLPIFGSAAASTWLWTLNPSPAYVGQGMIMGTSTTLHMLLGAIIGWGILSPLARYNEWAPGPVSDWTTGSRGWIIWVSLGIMLSDSVISLGGLILEPIIRSLWHKESGSGGYERLVGGGGGGNEYGEEGEAWGLFRRRNSGRSGISEQDDESFGADVPEEHLVPMKTVVIGLLASGLLCVVAMKVVFSMVPLYSTILAFLLALILSVMGVRALGQTDLNPVSGISKLTQLFFALITPLNHPSSIIINLVAGAISEAGAQQAGDIMQDLKTGHLLGASPRAQFHGQLLGSVFGAIISAGVYRLYTSVYPVPGKLFQVPTAYVWIDCSRLVFGQGLPEGARSFSVGFAVLFAVITVLRGWTTFGKGNWDGYLPGGIAVAVGMYNVPSFTLARVFGGLVQWWFAGRGRGAEAGLVVLASGLILGEGVVSIVNLGMASLGVPHL